MFCLPFQYEVSHACPAGWVFYKDDGTEGYDSCVYFSSTAASSWSNANSSCATLAANSHLLTIGAVGTSKLLAFASSLFHSPGSFAFVGCYQQSSAMLRGRSWSWVDSTDSSNLNCGTGIGAEGCSLWNATEPNDGGGSSGKFMFCGWYRRVPKCSPHGSVCCACAQRPGLPRARPSRAR